MYSARRFVGLWLGLTTLIIVYAFADLAMTPRLMYERGLTLQPDLSQLPDAVHWGGRLLRQSRAALVANAFVLGGMGALAAHSIANRLRRRREDAEPRISVYPANAGPPSVG